MTISEFTNAAASIRVGERLRISDSVLSPEDAASVTRWHATRSYTNVWNSGEGVRALFDGPGHFASTLIWDAKDDSINLSDDPIEALILNTIRTQARAASDLLGAEGEGWTSFTLTPWIHGAGTQLGWHTDRLEEGPERVGAFVWYVHDRWDFQWGGDFNVINAEIQDRPDWASIESWSQPDVITGAPDPTMVVCRPNRLIVFPTDTWHSVRRIDSTAGDRVRCTLTGFFMK